MDGFRIVCDLSAILDGIRKKSFLYVDIAKVCTISDLCMQIRASFSITKSVALLIDDGFLPFTENIRILRADDVIQVVLVDTAVTYSRRNGNGIPQSAEEIIQSSAVSTENADVQQLSSVFKQKKRKRITNVGEIQSENDAQILPEIISGSTEALGTQTQKKKKKHRKHKNICTKPDEESETQELTDLIPETVPGEIELSSVDAVVEVPIGESTADIPYGDPEPSLPSRKRKRIRTRKKKSVTSDMPPPTNTQQNIKAEPAINPYAKYFVNKVDSHASHIRFLSSKANEVKNQSVDYNPLEDDLLVEHSQSFPANSIGEKNCSEISGITNCIPKIIAPGSVTPLIVRRARVEPLQPVEPSKTRKFLQNPPEMNDIITFKIWKMDQDYCPQVSGLIKAKVLNFCKDSRQVRFFILDGKFHCEQPNGKFSLNVDFTEDGPSEPPTIPDIMELNWQEMLEVEIFL